MSNLNLPPYIKDLHQSTSQNILQAKEIPLIDDLIDANTATLIWAKSGGMKSLFTLDMVSSIAKGEEFLGYSCHQKRVLYVDGEMSDNSIKKRCITFGCLDMLTEEMLYLGRSVVDETSWFELVNSESRKKLIKLVREGEYEVVVLDSLRTLFKVEDENKAANYNVFVDFIIELRKYATVVAVHHANKGDSYAGSSNIITPFDYELQLAPTAEDGAITLRSDKHRDGPGITSLKGKLVRFDEGKFEVDAAAYIDMEYLAEKLIAQIEDGVIYNVEQLAAFYRKNKVGVSGRKATYKHIYNDLFAPFNTTPEYKTLNAFKDKINQNKKQQPAF